MVIPAWVLHRVLVKAVEGEKVHPIWWLLLGNGKESQQHQRLSHLHKIVGGTCSSRPVPTPPRSGKGDTEALPFPEVTSAVGGGLSSEQEWAEMVERKGEPTEVEQSLKEPLTSSLKWSSGVYSLSLQLFTAYGLHP